MSVVQAVVLAIVQGVTEFLPISSSGHLILTSWLFGWPDQGLVFDGAVHVGTLGAVLIYFRREWWSLCRGSVVGGAVALGAQGGGDAISISARRLLGFIAVATVPLVIAGLLLKDFLEDEVRSPEIVGGLLIVTAAVLWLAEVAGRRVRAPASGAVGWRSSALVGVAQAVAVLPGISRAGTTISAGMALGMSRELAARFSFLLAVPAIAGAGLFLIVDAIAEESLDGREWGLVALGVAISFVVGYAAIAGLLRLLRRRGFTPIIAYMVASGVAVLAARAAGA